MKTLLKTLSIIGLVAPIALFTSACDEESDDFEDIDAFDDADELRPAKAACPPCYVGGNTVYLGISDDYNPSTITNTSVKIWNSSASEWINYGTTLSVPVDPNTIPVTDSELCTVGSTGQPPTSAYVRYQLTLATGTITVGQSIPIVSVCP